MSGLPAVGNWRPLPLGEIASLLGGSGGWWLCGGNSVDLLLGRETRSHGDTDIGVYRSEAEGLLGKIARQRVHLCKPLRPWDGAPVPPETHDIWITDEAGECWVLQVMVYDDDGDEVVYRRDPRIRWPKAAHTIRVGSMAVLNPMVTLLFKLNKPRPLLAKDVVDMRNLIMAASDGSLQLGHTERQ